MIFYKFESMGNDFILLYEEDFCLEDVKNLCKEHFSIGADGIIILYKDKKYDIAMDIYNADGSKAKMCGNGLKIVGYFLHNILKIAKDEYKIIVNNNFVAYAGISNDEYYALVDYPLFKTKIDNYYIYNINNIHAVKVVDFLSKSSLIKDGKSEKFKGMNVSNLVILGDEEVQILTYENGVGITNSCGSASLCAFAYLHDKKYIKNVLSFHSLGGNYHIEKLGNKLCLFGKVNFIYKGEIYNGL